MLQPMSKPKLPEHCNGLVCRILKCRFVSMQTEFLRRLHECVQKSAWMMKANAEFTCRDFIWHVWWSLLTSVYWFSNIVTTHRAVPVISFRNESKRSGWSGFWCLIRRKALVSDNSGWRSYPVSLLLVREKDEIKHIELDFSVTYSSTCPCSAALARTLIQEKF